MITPMDVILDETTLVPCNDRSPALRIEVIAHAIKALDRLGCAKVLRSSQNAADSDIGQGYGLRHWCFDRGTPRDAGRFIAQRLGKQPFIDGIDGLFANAEGERFIEGRMDNATVVGLTYAALTDSTAIALGSNALPSCTTSIVEVTTFDGQVEKTEAIPICRLVTEQNVQQEQNTILQRIERSVKDGRQLLERAGDLFPSLRFGSNALDQIGTVTGKDPVFHQLFRHLRALGQGAATWEEGREYSPSGAITWSRESNQTLDHGVYGPLRDFPVPDGFAQRRWCCHTKLSGGAGVRLYFHAERTPNRPVVLIGYFGKHLPTVRYD